MINRSTDFWLAGFFLSKYGTGVPPEELDVRRWNQAYYRFYDSLAGGRTISAFEHSLKNARDTFDSHTETSARIGWRNEERGPRKLEKNAEIVWDRYSDSDRETIWNLLAKHVSKIVPPEVINDISAEQEASDGNPVTTKTEGGKKVVTIYKYERNLALRSRAFEIYGYNCAVCEFNFEKFYGVWGKGFGEVHHLLPLSDSDAKRETDPETDLIILCSNCHRMVHRKRGITLTVKELKKKIISAR